MRLITRERLLTPFNPGTHENWLIEAGHGFGKSTLLGQMVEQAGADVPIVVRLNGASDVDGLRSRIAAAIRRAAVTAPTTERALGDELIDSGRLLVVDDAHLLTPDAGQFLADLLAELRSDLSVIVSGRSLPTALHSLRSDLRWRNLGASELAFTRSEVAESLKSHGVEDASFVTSIERLSGGWPLAVQTAGLRLSEAVDPAAVLQQLSRQDSLTESLLRPLAEDLSSDDQQTAVALANLPFFDATIADSLGAAGVLDRLAHVGIPLVRDRDGWVRYSEPSRSFFGGQNTQPRQLPRSAVDHFVGRGEAQAAINACLASGDPEGAAQVIAGLGPSDEVRLNPAQLDAAMANIASAAELAPRSLYIHSRVNTVNGRQAEGLALMERAVEVFAASDSELTDPAHVEALLALGTWRAYQGRAAEATAISERCAARLGPDDDPALHASLHDLNGVLFQTAGSDSDLQQATDEMVAALAIWRKIGRTNDAAVTTFRLTSGVLERRGRYAEALTMLDELPQVGPMTMVTKARLGIFKALLLPLVGRAGEVAALLEEPRQVAQALGQPQLTSKALIAEMLAGSVMYDAQRVRAAADQFISEGYLLPDQAFSAAMWLDAVTAFARCELHDESTAALDRIRETPGLPEWFVHHQDASIQARMGDPASAIHTLDDLVVRDEVEPNSRWTFDLLRAYAWWRQGDTEQASKHLDEAFRQAAVLHQPNLPRLLESRLVDRIRGNEDVAQAPVSQQVSVNVFDEFSVVVRNEVTPPRAGQTTNLVKLLAIGGGTLLVDQIIDALWPDADLEVGRRRLRNVVKRVRDDCGPILVRTDDAISFSDEVAVDLLFARSAADNALAARTEDSIQLALTLADRPLLPVDRYEDWAEDARDEQRALVLRLLDLQAEVLAAAGTDAAGLAASVERALTLDPINVGRLRRGAQNLRSLGAETLASRLEDSFST